MTLSPIAQMLPAHPNASMLSKRLTNRVFSMILRTLFIVCVVFVASVGNARAQQRNSLPAISIEVVGAPETVFVKSRDACAPNHIPDAPARAFRDAKGNVHLIAAHHINRAMVGPSLDRVRVDCGVVFRSASRADPGAFDDQGWIAAVHTGDGLTVHALVHEEFHGHLRRDLCPAGRYAECWWNSVTAAVSHDGGRSFDRPPGRHLVASLPQTYSGGSGRALGIFSPSNIVSWRGHLYVAVFAEPGPGGQRGPCLLRTDRPEDPASWRAWNGIGFTVRFDDPYKAGAGAPEKTSACTPVAATQATITSLLRHEPSGRFVALIAARRAAAGSAQPVAGFFAMTSADLVRWSMPELVWAGPLLFAPDCSAPRAYAYPSLLDPESRTLSFETVGDGGYIYFTALEMRNCRPTMERDLLRVKVRLTAR